MRNLAGQYERYVDSYVEPGENAPLLRFLAVAGLFSWFAILIYNFTQDSFAIPNIWINFGILVGLTVYGLESEISQHASNAVLGVGQAAEDGGLSNQEYQ